MKPEPERTIAKGVIIVVVLLAAYVFLVSLAAYHVADTLHIGSCFMPVPILILLLSSLGVLVGSVSYYLLSAMLARKSSKNASVMLRYLPDDEAAVLKAILEHGSQSQASLQRYTGLHKVKTHRVVNRLVAKGMLQRQKGVRKPAIQLTDELSKIFS